MNVIIIILLLSCKYCLSHHECIPLKFVPPVYQNTDTQTAEYPFCIVDQPNTRIQFINNIYCIATNNCSSLIGPLHSAKPPQSHGRSHILNVSVPNGGWVNVEAKIVSKSCQFNSCTSTDIYYTPDGIFLNEIQILKANPNITCSNAAGDKIIIVLQQNKSLSNSASVLLQYPPIGVRKRIAHSPYFNCLFSGVAWDEVRYQKVGTNITREIGQKLTPGLWNCTAPDFRSGLIDYADTLVVDVEMKDCVTVKGGSCRFNSSMETWGWNSTRRNLYWVINAKIMHKWDHFSRISVENITESASIQSFAQLNSSIRNITATSSARIIAVDKPSLFLQSPQPASLGPNQIITLKCVIPIHPLLTNMSRLNFYFHDHVVTPSSIYQISPISENIKRKMKIFTNYTTNPENITGLYSCVLESDVYGRIQSPPVWIQYHSNSNFSARILVVLVIVVLIILIFCCLFSMFRRCMGSDYNVRNAENAYGMSNNSYNFLNLPEEQKPFLKYKEDIVSDDDDIARVYRSNAGY